MLSVETQLIWKDNLQNTKANGSEKKPQHESLIVHLPTFCLLNFEDTDERHENSIVMIEGLEINFNNGYVWK